MDSETKAFLRRIKRHVVGPDHHFAVVVPPELAPLCLNECLEIGIPGPQLTDAGIEFSGKLRDAYICHLGLRTAGRVLCRLPSFRAGISEELFYKAGRIPWELWLNPEVPVVVDAHVELSRINHEGRIVELISEAIEKYFRERLPDSCRVRPLVSGDDNSGREQGCPLPPTSGAPEMKQKILVHLIKNHCRISLDMSGPHLHERGYRIEHTGAPLRETLAAAILLKSGWNGREPLIDGMCGSGTFPIEAAMMSRRIAPGISRAFLFQRWPSFQEEMWEYLRRKAEEGSTAKTPGPIIGIDSDSKAAGVAGENAVRAGVGGDIEFRQMDFFDFDPGESRLKEGLLVLNPPYGKRLGRGGKDLYKEIGAHLRKNFKGWKYALLAPSRSEAAAMTGSARLWNIKHGGIPITVALGRVSKLG
ncbi:MAG: class I SAM-dependent RNA methyltransferase [Syntrophobacteraceae bacterium]